MLLKGFLMDWHTLSSSVVLEKLKTSEKGLAGEEIQHRQKTFGLNQLRALKKPSSIFRFLRQFNNILIYILLIAGVATLFLNHRVDSGVIFGVVIINAIIGFVQEGKAEKALEAIRHMLSPSATVIRDGERRTIQAVNLVPGDIVLLQSGDKVAADIRLIQTKTLQIQEAILTGESNPVTKQAEPVVENAALADRLSMAYSGTLVVYGRGLGVVVETGMRTEVGKISAMLQHVQKLSTPLLQQMEKLGRWLTLMIVLLALMTFLFGVLLWHQDLTEMFMASVGLAVAAIPEGLPAIVTITLAMGVTRMARRNAIIRRLPAVEIMGSVSTICTDKTGTLTRNELAVQTIVTREHTYHLTDDHLDEILEKPELRMLILSGMLCNDASNPIDHALLALAVKTKLNLNLENEKYPRMDMIPFESENKWMATLHHDHEGNGYIFLKGAPEKIFSHCEMIDQFWREKLERLASKGMRVLALAYKKISTEKEILNNEEVDNHFIFLGLFGLIDPPREEVPSAVAECKNAGIQIKMITGDHSLTAKTIAAQVGIENSEQVLTGDKLDEMSDDDLAREVTHVNVYARTSPAHKLRLVRALQKNHHIVAMTGDGVNDAPALKQADIGIAMGKKGTEAAKEASEMVLTDDNFISIRDAVKEGRTVYDNLKKALLYILPTNVAESFGIVFAIIFGLILPITAVQILWVNMITTVTLSLTIAFEHSESQVMRRLPRKPDESLLSSFVIWRSFFVGFLFVGALFLLFHFEQTRGASLNETRTAVVDMLVMAEAVYLINSRKLIEATWHHRNLWENYIALIGIISVIIFQLLFTYLPMMQKFFGTAAISLTAWVEIMVLSIILFFIVEVEKMVIREKIKGKR